jgi:hypothetical protein
MPKATVTEPARPAVVKECPKCHSTMFQGPWQRGPIVDGVFAAKETLYNCVGCHVVLSVAEMQDRVPLAAEL